MKKTFIYPVTEGDNGKVKKSNESGYISEEDKKSEDSIATATAADDINAQVDEKCTNDQNDTEKVQIYSNRIKQKFT